MILLFLANSTNACASIMTSDYICTALNWIFAVFAIALTSLSVATNS